MISAKEAREKSQRNRVKIESEKKIQMRKGIKNLMETAVLVGQTSIRYECNKPTYEQMKNEILADFSELGYAMDYNEFGKGLAGITFMTISWEENHE